MRIYRYQIIESHAATHRWYTCGVNDFMSRFAGMHQEEFLARMVLSLLALLVQRYTYWHIRARGMHQEEFLARMALTLLALLGQKYKY